MKRLHSFTQLFVSVLVILLSSINSIEAKPFNTYSGHPKPFKQASTAISHQNADQAFLNLEEPPIVVDDYLICEGNVRKFKFQIILDAMAPSPISNVSITITNGLGDIQNEVVTFTPPIQPDSNSTLQSIMVNIPANNELCWVMSFPTGDIIEGCLVEPFCPPAECVELSDEPIVCVDGYFLYKLTINNIGSNQINSLRLTGLTPNVFINGLNPLILNQPIAPGTSVTLNLILTGSGAVAPNLFQAKLEYYGGPNATGNLICENNIGSVAFRSQFNDLPAPPFPEEVCNSNIRCSLTDVNITPVNIGGNPCCWNVDLNHQLTLGTVFFINFTASGGVVLTPNFTSPGDWNVSTIPNGFQIRPAGGGPIVPQDYGTIFTFCVPSEAASPLTVEASWIIIPPAPALGQTQCKETFTLEFACAPVNCEFIKTPANTTQIDPTNNPIVFTNVPGNGPDIGISHLLLPAVDNTWKAEFDMTITNIGASGGALVPFMLTAGPNPPTQFSPPTTIDALGIVVWTPFGQQSPIWIAPYVKDGTQTAPFNCKIAIAEDVAHTIVFERISPTSGKLTVRTTGGQFIGDCCFDIPQTLTGLTHVQATNWQPAYSGRRISGIVEKVCATTEPTSTCPDTSGCVTIISDSIYCENGVVKVLFTVQNNSAVPINSISILPSDPTITVTPPLVNVTILPSQTVTITPAFMLTGTGVNPSNEFCYSLFAYGGINGVDRLNCIDSIIENCKLIPPCDANCEFTKTPANTTQIDPTNNPIVFTNVPGNGSDIGISHLLLPAVDNTWKAEFDMTITNIGASGGALVPFMLTAGSNPPTQFSPPTTIDALGIVVWTPFGQQSPIWIAPYVKDGTQTAPFNCKIAIAEDVAHTIVFERISPTSGKLTVRTTGGQFIGDCCFDIPQTITGLTHVQATNWQPAYSGRRISGIVEKVCATTEPTSTCPDTSGCVTIISDSIYCENGVVKVLFTIQNNSAAPINSISILPSDPTITITPPLVNVTILPSQTVTITPAFVLTGTGVNPSNEFCYSLFAYGGINGVDRLNCIDSIIENCKLIPDCVDCDSLNVVIDPILGSPTPPDCCYNVSLQSPYSAGTICSVTFTQPNGYNVSYTATDPVNWAIISIFNPWIGTLASLNPGCFPSGDLSDIIQICPDPNAPYPQLIEVLWTLADGTTCKDSVYLEKCGPDPCAAYSNPTLTCVNGQWQFCFEAFNNGFGPLSQLVSISGSSVVTPNPVSVSLPPNTGAVYCVNLTGPPPVVGSQWCVELGIKLPNDAVSPCFDTCLIVPICTDTILCDSLVATLTPQTQANPDLCCFVVNLQNNTPAGSIGSVVFETSDGSELPFVFVGGPNYTNTTNPPNLNLAFLTHNSGSIPSGVLSSLYTVCVPVGDTITVYVYWRDENGEIICIDTLNISCSNPPCDNFDDQVVGGWGVYNIFPNGTTTYSSANVIMGAAGPSSTPTDFALQFQDVSGATWALNTTEYDGNWKTYLGKCLCYDYKVSDDSGSGTIPVSPSIFLFGPFDPTMPIVWGVNPVLAAQWVPMGTITQQDGWGHYCAPLEACTGGVLPSNANGSWQWVVGAGSTCANWDSLLCNVGAVGFILDFTSTPQEEIQIDNICIQDCDEPAPCDIITSQSLDCVNNQLQYCVTVTNSTNAPLVTSLDLISNTAGVTVPSNIAVNVAPNSQQTYCVPVTSTLPAGSQWCYILSVVKDSTLFPCIDTCVVLPACGVDCDSVDVTATWYNQTNPDTCCFRINLVNNAQAGSFTGVSFLAASGSLEITGGAAPWILMPFGFITTTGVTVFHPSGTIPTGSFSGVFEMCIPRGQTETLYITWFNGPNQICTDSIVLGCSNPPCDNFDDQVVGGWGVYNISNGNATYSSASVVTGVSGPSNTPTDFALQFQDISGATWALNTTEYDGNWKPYLGKCLCYDYKVFDDSGNGTIPVSPSIFLFGPFDPTMPIVWGVNPALAAQWIPSGTITQQDGWGHYCAPLEACTGGVLPSNANGSWQWVVGAGSTCANWDSLLCNIGTIGFVLDFTSNPAEEIQIDNICIQDCDEPAPCDIITSQSLTCVNNQLQYCVTVTNATNVPLVTSLDLISSTPGVTAPSTIAVNVPANSQQTYCVPVTSTLLAGSQWCYILSVVKDSTLFPCVDTCVIIPPCNNPCVNINVTATPTPVPDDCCYTLTVSGLQQGQTISTVTLTAPAGTILSVSSFATGWTATGNNTSTLVLTGAAGSTLTNIAQICVTGNATVQVTYAGNNTYCPDALDLACNPCVNINVTATPTPAPDDCCYTLTVSGLQQGQTINTVTLTAPAGTTISASSFATGWTATGNNTSTLVLTATAGSTLTNIAQICVSGNTTVQVTYAGNNTYCPDALDLACNPCVNINITATPTPAPDDCCYTLTVSGLQQGQTINTVTLTAPAGTTISASSFATGWTATGNNTGTLVLTAAAGATLTNIAQICVSGSATVQVTYTGNNTYCPDSLVLACNPCVNINITAAPTAAPDDCCYTLTVSGLQQGQTINTVTLTAPTGTTISASSFATGWTATGNNTSTLVLTATAGSTLTNIAQICMSGSATVQVTYTGNNVYCPDSLVLTCPDPCDPECYVDPMTGLNLSTGYTEETSTVIPAVGIDGDWFLVDAPDPGLSLPLPAFVVGQQIFGWTTLPNTNWISAYPYSLQNATNLPPAKPYTFRNCFGVCDSSEIKITASAHIDNWLYLYLGTPAGMPLGTILNVAASNPSTYLNPPETGMLTTTLAAGEYCLFAELRNDNAQSPMGMDLAINIMGENLEKETCTPGNFNAIIGEKYWDKNCDGDRDNVTIETGIANWTIELYDAVPNLVATTTTNAFGMFQFAQIPPGTYTIKEVNQTGWTQTEPVSPNFYTVTIGIDDEKGIYRFGNCSDQTLPCDYDVFLTPTNAPNDTCCWLVDIINLVPNPSALLKVEFSSQNGEEFSVMSMSPAWTVNQTDPYNAAAYLTAGGPIPSGTYNDVLKICAAASDSPVQITVYYVKQDNKFCKDDLVLTCPDTTCKDINIAATPTAAPDDCCYTLNVSGLQTGQTITTVTVTAPTATTIAASNFGTGWSATGNNTGTLVLTATSGATLTSIAQICMSGSGTVQVTYIGNNEYCPDSLALSCPDTCQDISIAANPTAAPDDCCYTLTVSGLLTGQTITTVTLTAPTATTIAASNFGTGWTATGNNTGTLVLTATAGSALTNIAQICLSGTATVQVTYTGNNDYCPDSLVLTCPIDTCKNINIAATPTAAPDDCCYTLNVSGLQTGQTITTVTVTAPNATTIAASNFATGWTATGNNTGTLVLTATAGSSLTNIAQICFSGTATVQVTYTGNNDYCPDSLVLTCPTCKDITIAATPTAAPDDCCYTLNVSGLQTGQTITTVTVTAPTATTIAASNFGTGWSATGNNTGTLVLTSTAGSALTNIAQICMSGSGTVQVTYTGNNDYCPDSLVLTCPTCKDITIAATPTAAPDDCCYTLNVSGLQTGQTITTVTVSAPTATTIAASTFATGWTATGNNTGTLVLTSIAGATLTNIAQICMSGSGTVQVTYAGNNDYCPDSLVLTCPIDTTDGCVKIIGDEIYCENGVVKYSFYLKNEWAYPIQSIELIPTNTNIEVDPDEIVIAPPGILPGATEGPYVVDLIGTLVPGSPFCLVIKVNDKPLNQNPLHTHLDTIDTGCRIIPACPLGICLDPSADNLQCNTENALEYTFTVTNPITNTFAIQGIKFDFAELDPTKKFIVEPFEVTPALTPGQTRTFTVDVYKWGNCAGADMCFSIEGVNTTAALFAFDTLAFNCDTTCWIVPRCDSCYACCTDKDIILPTGLSPNGDGMNDVYKIMSINGKVCPMEIRIYNRWGNLVWKEEGVYANDWAGTNQDGSPLAEGTYFVMARIKSTSATLTNFVDLRR